MLSAQKAKFRSALDNTNSQTARDRQQKKKPIQTCGINNNFPIKTITFFMLFIFELSEFIEFLSSNWFIVSKDAASTIREIINNTFVFIVLLLRPYENLLIQKLPRSG